MNPGDLIRSHSSSQLWNGQNGIPADWIQLQKGELAIVLADAFSSYSILVLTLHGLGLTPRADWQVTK